MGNLGSYMKNFVGSGRNDETASDNDNEEFCGEMGSDAVEKCGSAKRLNGQVGFLFFLKEKLANCNNEERNTAFIEQVIDEYDGLTEVDKDVWKIKQMYFFNNDGTPFDERNCIRNFLLDLRSKMPKVSKATFLDRAYEKYKELSVEAREELMDDIEEDL